MDERGLTLAAPAKVNLLLRVREREPSGYHRLQTVFCALELSDELQLALDPEPGVRLRVEGARLGDPEGNLVVRAARAWLAEAGPPTEGDWQGVTARLTKRIPHGGGLGGGSSDAAATLRGLTALLPGRVPEERVAALGTALGSDVPFFLSQAPLCWAEGYGERLTPLPPLPARPVVLAIPPFRISTPVAYGWLDADRRGPGPFEGEAEGETAPPADWSDLATRSVNDFERSVFRRHPELRALRDRLRRSGAVPALLSGSGSTVFGIFESDARAEAAAETMQREAPGVGVVLTRTAAR